MRYFKKEEFVKDPDKVDPSLIDTIDELRHIAGVPIHIHVAWSASGHSDKSYHYKGMAVDFHFAGLTHLEQWAYIRCFPNLRGIGFYPWWKNPGWHADLRSTELFWISRSEGEYIYSAEALVKELINGR